MSCELFFSIYIDFNPAVCSGTESAFRANDEVNSLSQKRLSDAQKEMSHSPFFWRFNTSTCITTFSVLVTIGVGASHRSIDATQFLNPLTPIEDNLRSTNRKARCVIALRHRRPGEGINWQADNAAAREYPLQAGSHFCNCLSRPPVDIPWNSSGKRVRGKQHDRANSFRRSECFALDL
jgi:hypothetical protein